MPPVCQNCSINFSINKMVGPCNFINSNFCIIISFNMIDIKVYVLLDDFSYERRTFKRFLKHVFGKLNFSDIYGIDFLYNPLSLEQYVRLGNSLSDCIVSNRLEHKLTGWNFLVSNYCMLT